MSARWSQLQVIKKIEEALSEEGTRTVAGVKPIV